MAQLSDGMTARSKNTQPEIVNTDTKRRSLGGLGTSVGSLCRLTPPVDPFSFGALGRSCEDRVRGELGAVIGSSPAALEGL